MRDLGVFLMLIIRGQRRSAVVMDLVVLFGVGLFVSFMILFVARPVTDAAVFESGLDYQFLSAKEPGAGMVDVVHDASVAVPDPVLEKGNSPRKAVLFDKVGVTAWLVDDNERMRSILGASGTDLAGSGMWLDRASAHTLGVDVGDLVSVGAGQSVLSTGCEIRVAGFVRPYAGIPPTPRNGLAVVPSSACSRQLAAAVDSSIEFNGSGQSKTERIRFALTSSPELTATTTATLLIALALWVWAARRVGARSVQDSDNARTIVTALGGSPLGWRLAHLMTLCAVGIPAAILATLGARIIIHAMTDFYVQPANGIITAMVLVVAYLVAAMPTLRASARARSRERISVRDTASGAPAPSLSYGPERSM